MSGRTPCTFTAYLVAGTGTAGLLRVVSILHSRGAEVRHLSAEHAQAGGMVVTGVATLANAEAHTLSESLRRCPIVLDGQVEAGL